MHEEILLSVNVLEIYISSLLGQGSPEWLYFILCYHNCNAVYFLNLYVATFVSKAWARPWSTSWGSPRPPKSRLFRNHWLRGWAAGLSPHDHALGQWSALSGISTSARFLPTSLTTESSVLLSYWGLELRFLAGKSSELDLKCILPFHNCETDTCFLGWKTMKSCFIGQDTSVLRKSRRRCCEALKWVGAPPVEFLCRCLASLVCFSKEGEGSEVVLLFF